MDGDELFLCLLPVLFLPSSSEASRDQQSTGVLRLQPAHSWTWDITGHVDISKLGWDVQCTVATVTWNDSLERWHCLVLMVNSSMYLLESCPWIRMCPTKAASNPAFLFTCCSLGLHTHGIYLHDRVQSYSWYQENNSTIITIIPLMSLLACPFFFGSFFFLEKDLIFSMRKDGRTGPNVALSPNTPIMFPDWCFYFVCFMFCFLCCYFLCLVWQIGPHLNPIWSLHVCKSGCLKFLLSVLFYSRFRCMGLFACFAHFSSFSVIYSLWFLGSSLHSWAKSS